MIIVDIYVPAMDKTYDFKLDEDEKVQVLTEEIIEMICQKEQSVLKGDMKDVILCSRDTRNVLEENSALKSAGIRTGDTLILV